MTIKTFTLSLALSVFATTAMATDYSAMRKDARVHNDLLGASTAYLIDEGCSDLKLRKLRLLNKAFSLQKYARTLGYSISEIKAYVDSKTEQDRFRVIAGRELAKLGARKGDEASYCAVGRAEMKKGSFAGSLLAD